MHGLCIRLSDRIKNIQPTNYPDIQPASQPASTQQATAMRRTGGAGGVEVEVLGKPEGAEHEVGLAGSA